MAARFWVGSSGTWDTSSNNWAATDGGAPGSAAAPTTADTVTFSSQSGGGTVTVNTSVAVQSITMGAFTGTLDFATNNNNVTLSANTGFTANGSGVCTLSMGSGTWSLSGGACSWDATNTNLTLVASASTISFTSTAPTAARNFVGGNKTTYNVVSVAGSSLGIAFIISGTPSIASFVVTAPNSVLFTASTTTTIASFTAAGSGSSVIGLMSTNSNQTAATVAVTSATITGAAIRLLAFTVGTPVATDSFNIGGNSGITITAPSTTAASGGGGFVIGGG